MGSKLSRDYSAEARFLPNAGGKKHICVIGGGSSSLMVMKELKMLGHTFEAFEMLPRLGGVYLKAYDNTLLTTSSLLTAWSDYSDGLEDCPKFWSAEEYLQYLNCYAEKHDLTRHMHFRTKVINARRDPITHKWHITVIGGRGFATNPRYGIGEPDDPTAVEQTLLFDGIAVCSGTNTWSYVPHFDGQEAFIAAGGRIIHSDDYKTAKEFKDRNVLIVGSGESGSDICNDVSREATSCAISVRGKHGHLIPRIQANNRVTDLNTNRIRYSNPYIIGDWVGYFNQMAKRFVASTTIIAADDGQVETGKLDGGNLRVLKKIAELNMEQKTSAFSKFGCKNAGFVEAIVDRNCKLFRCEFRLEAGRVVFEDGSIFDCDTVLACTGFRNSFPMFDDHHPDIVAFGRAPRKLYKQIFHPEYGWEVSFFGFARPAFGSIPPTVEMQARLYSLVVNGEKELPSKADMERIADIDRRNWEWRFHFDAARVKGLVDFQVYLDSLAHEIGCFPPLGELFFTKPSVWFKILFGPFTTHQFRIIGPYSNRVRAYDVYSRQPVGDFLESSITVSCLMTAKILSWFGFKQFTPNNF